MGQIILEFSVSLLINIAHLLQQEGMRPLFSEKDQAIFESSDYIIAQCRMSAKSGPLFFIESDLDSWPFYRKTCLTWGRPSSSKSSTKPSASPDTIGRLPTLQCSYATQSCLQMVSQSSSLSSDGLIPTFQHLQPKQCSCYHASYHVTLRSSSDGFIMKFHRFWRGQGHTLVFTMSADVVRSYCHVLTSSHSPSLPYPYRPWSVCLPLSFTSSNLTPAAMSPSSHPVVLICSTSGSLIIVSSIFRCGSSKSTMQCFWHSGQSGYHPKYYG